MTRLGNAKGTLVALGAVLIFTYMGASALGAGGLKTKTVTLAPDEQDAATAKCEKGSKAVSGGFKADFEPEGPDPTPGIVVMESTRSGGRGWSSAGLNLGDAIGDLTSVAYCRAGKTEGAAETVPMGEGEGASVTARCPRETEALSGGFDVVPDMGFRNIKSSRKSGKRAWSVAVPRTQFGGPGLLTAQVVCRKGKSLKTKRVSESLKQGEEVKLEVKCRRDQRVVSGGFEAFEDETLGFAAPDVATSRKRGRRTWIVDVVAANEATATAYAYCEKAR